MTNRVNIHTHPQQTWEVYDDARLVATFYAAQDAEDYAYALKDRATRTELRAIR